MSKRDGERLAVAQNGHACGEDEPDALFITEASEFIKYLFKIMVSKIIDIARMW